MFLCFEVLFFRSNPTIQPAVPNDLKYTKCICGSNIHTFIGFSVNLKILIQQIPLRHVKFFFLLNQHAIPSKPLSHCICNQSEPLCRSCSHTSRHELWPSSGCIRLNPSLHIVGIRDLAMKLELIRGGFEGFSMNEQCKKRWQRK